MRTVLTILGVAVAVTSGGAQVLSGLHATIGPIEVPASPRPCDAKGIALGIARAANVPIGFEDLPECTTESYPPKGFPRRVPPYSGQTVLLERLSVRQAFDRLTTVTPAFEYRDINGIATIRPKDAWNNPNDLLNLPAHPVHAAVGLFDAVSWVLHNRASGQQDTRPFSLTFPGGTLVDGLDAIIKAAHGESWMAITIEHPTNWPPTTSPVAVVEVNMPHAGPGTSTIFSARDVVARNER